MRALSQTWRNVSIKLTSGEFAEDCRHVDAPGVKLNRFADLWATCLLVFHFFWYHLEATDMESWLRKSADSEWWRSSDWINVNFSNKWRMVALSSQHQFTPKTWKLFLPSCVWSKYRWTSRRLMECLRYGVGASSKCLFAGHQALSDKSDCKNGEASPPVLSD